MDTQSLPINSENILIVAEAIEKYDRYDQEVWFAGDVERMDIELSSFTLHNAECGTVMCVAGWAAALAGFRGGDIIGIQAEAAEFMGLDEEAADLLFYAYNPGKNVTNINAAMKERIVAQLRYFAKTGSIVYNSGVVYDTSGKE